MGTLPLLSLLEKRHHMGQPPPAALSSARLAPTPVPLPPSPRHLLQGTRDLRLLPETPPQLRWPHPHPASSLKHAKMFDEHSTFTGGQLAVPHTASCFEPPC